MRLVEACAVCGAYLDAAHKYAIIPSDGTRARLLCARCYELMAPLLDIRSVESGVSPERWKAVTDRGEQKESS